MTYTTERDSNGRTRVRRFITTEDPWAAQRLIGYAQQAKGCGEVAAVMQLSQDADPHDVSVLLHAFAGPGTVLRPGGRPDSLHPMFLGRSAQLSAASRVILTPQALQGLHAKIGRSIPGPGEISSPWVPGGVWATGPDADGLDPRLEALARIAADRGERVQVEGGRIVGSGPVAVIASWLVGVGRARLADHGYPHRGWLSHEVAALVPSSPLSGRPLATAAAAVAFADRLVPQDL